jgi:hypothetical protein|tara:strand:+ start:108 stop:548 length:441 start_codon:yes stop_codon:yes gene_type:complete
MGLLDKLKRKVENTLADSRLEEELIYKHILEEMDSGVIRDGLYAKAMANSNGDESKAKSLYMKYRLQSVKDAMGGNSYLEYVEKLNLEEKKKNKGNKLIKKQISEKEAERLRKFNEIKRNNKKIKRDNKKIEMQKDMDKIILKQKN